MSVGNPHIGKSDFSGSISIWIQSMALDAPGILRHERHVGIEQQAEIGLFQQRQGIEAGEARRILRNIEIDRIEFRDPDAAGQRQPLQRRDGLRLAAEIGRQRDRIFRRHQSRRRSHRRAPARCRRPARCHSGGRIGRHLRRRPIPPPASRAAASCRPGPGGSLCMKAPARASASFTTTPDGSEYSHLT